MKIKNKSIRKTNRKGDVSLYFILFAVIAFAISFLLYMGKLEGSMHKTGENTIKIINTFETSERLFFYIDASVELAAKSAENEIMQNSGYLQEIFKGEVLNAGCGILAYPIIDSDKIINSQKGINECFPDYEEELKIAFTRNVNTLLVNYDPLQIDPSNFKTTINEERDGLNIKFEAGADINLPIYAYIESYYKDADKTKTSKETPNTITITPEGYFTMRIYSVLNSFSRGGTTPTKIVIHDTKTSSVQETFLELQTGLKNYNYVIDKAGEIYLFASESRRTRNSGCTKGGTQNTCIIEGTDEDSISIALVNAPLSKAHTQSQINSLINLIAEISARNPTIEITGNSILLNSEIDSSRIDDPALDIALRKADIILKAEVQKNEELTKAAETSSSVSSQELAGATSDSRLTGNVVIPSDVDEAKCFSDIKTTLYYTPELNDHGTWSTYESPCPNSYGYCCIPEEDRGFYEDVMCQGSGVAAGRVYHYTKISPDGLTQSTPLPLTEFTRGITSRGKDPVPHRTVAADPNCPGFSYGSKLYIYWGEDNPWNGYYVVEDTGGAFKGNCKKLDIYAGVGKTELADASKYVTASGKVCILDDDFKVQDPDFSGSSTFVDPTTGEYNVPYVHDFTMSEIKTLFDETKLLLSKMINECGKKRTDAEKEICIAEKMQTAETIHKLNVNYCDEEVKERIWTTEDASNDMPLVVQQFKKSYKIMGTITQVSVNNINLFATFTQNTQQEQQTETEQTLLSAITQTPAYAIITITDESGTELEVNISGEAVEWIDYFNQDSILYESQLFLRPGTKVLMNITRVLNKTHNGYYVTKFGDISEYPREIMNEEIIKLAKTLAECATSKTTCTCTTEPSRMLDLVMMSETELSAVNNEEIKLKVPFTISQSALFDSSVEQNFLVDENKVSLITAGDSPVFPQCVPAKRYRYICSSLADNEEFGTLKYTLKI